MISFVLTWLAEFRQHLHDKDANALAAVCFVEKLVQRKALLDATEQN